MDTSLPTVAGDLYYMDTSPPTVAGDIYHTDTGLPTVAGRFTACRDAKFCVSTGVFVRQRMQSRQQAGL
ncbi:MAG: hypothetical protein LBS42_04180 [Tannerella sp.]|nr:hypothetical protein [Tannerella sp.]